MSPFFDPGPIAHPKIAIYLAAVNDGMFRAAGEIADGIEAHPFSTPAYLRDVGMAAVKVGLERSKRTRADITIACPVFTLVEASPTYAADAAYVRGQIAFYASTPTYRAVLTHHGWDAIGEETASRWPVIWKHVSDGSPQTLGPPPARCQGRASTRS